MTNFYRIIKTEIFLANGDPTSSSPPTPGYHGRIIIENLRMSFSIQKNLSLTTNSCVLRIWNLSQDTRNKLRQFGDAVILSAGYQNQLTQPISYDGNTQNVGILFFGVSTNVRHSYEYPDIVTTLEFGDGQAVSNDKTDSSSYAPGTPAREVLIRLAAKLGLDFSEFAPTENIVYPTGFAYAGSAKDEIDKICKYLGTQWSIQNGKLQVIPLNGTTSKPAVPINVDTGMIGIPERYSYKRLSFTRDGPLVGYKVRTILRPDILPGDTVLISSTHINLSPGNYRVETIRHEGDTYGPSWFSNIETTLRAPII